MRKFLAALVAVLAVTFGALAPVSATGTLHQYFYDTSGIDHIVGYPHSGVNMVYGSDIYTNRTVWATPFPNSNQSMWYGPKDTVYGGGATFHVCWDYVPPDNSDAHVVFDITSGSTPTILWSSGNVTITNVQRTFGYPWVLKAFCHDIYIATFVDKFQMRAHTVSGGGGTEDEFAIYKVVRQDP